MPKHIVAFGASNSRQSINKRFATYVAQQLDHVHIQILDLNDFEMPIYSIDREKESGIPDLAQKFWTIISEADALIISFAEHNGSYTAAFKNIYDWASRISRDNWKGKPMLLLSTSPGGRGGKTVLGQAVAKFRRMNPDAVTSFSLPSFTKNFSETNGILDPALRDLLQAQITQFETMLKDQG